MSEIVMNEWPVSSALRLPGIDQPLQNLVAMAQDPGVTMGDLASAVETDPAILFDYLKFTETSSSSSAQSLASWHQGFDVELARVIAATRLPVVLIRSAQIDPPTSIQQLRRSGKILLAQQC
jgi:hypothetical protein